MRHASLRSILVAFTALTAAPAFAQEAPPVVDPAPRIQDIIPEPPVSAPSVAPPPLIVVGEGAQTAAPTIEPIPRVWSPSPRDGQGRTAYGLYLTGRSALARGQAEQGAAYLSAVESLTPEQPTVRDQAFTSALLAGDLDIAARIAPDAATAAPVIAEAGALVSVVQTFVSGDAKAANDALKARPVLAPHARAAALIGPWIAAAAGDWDTALAEPNPSGDPITVLFGRYHHAQLLEHRRRFDEAEAELHDLAFDARAAPLFRAAYGEFLERRGKRDEALAFYDSTLAAGSQDPAIVSAKSRVESRTRPPALSNYRDGAARALIVAARQVGSEGANEFAVVYLRLSLNLQRDPETIFLLGQTLAQANLDATSRAVLGSVPRTDPRLYASAQVMVGLSLAEAGDQDQALTAFEAAREAAPTDPRIALITAGHLLQLNRYDDALVLLNGPLLDTENQAANVRFMRGAAYESLNRVPEAEAQLWAALQAEPNDPTYLNYLGYLWVDSGARVAEGAEMIARAHAADPTNGNIQDSLGWAQYRQGQFDTAVETLEQAVAKEPANAEINDHLGDAYWQVGRRREAGFQWNRVLTLDPDDERRAEVERKLTEGLAL
ncbi:tetratricopeptide repeat protein [Brevundimonas staleyi]|uniref:Tetratricopeptide repeat protein n=1 Tax=Brevundimonas staleyi TaxID=74326 RepID=A0ABW0FW54_9CAUL